jgi:membrane protein DedA with SNARE-associated domain
MEQKLLDFVEAAGAWAYVLVFVFALLECAAFVGLLVPGESMVVFAGFLAGRGALELPLLLPAVWIGAVLGDNAGYWMGREVPRPWVLAHGGRLGITQGALEKAEDYFRRHGGKTVLFGRFIGFLRALAPFVAGSSRMPWPRFLGYNAAGAVLWSTAFTLLGFFAGESWHRIEDWLSNIGTSLGLAAVALFVAIKLIRRRRSGSRTEG